MSRDDRKLAGYPVETLLRMSRALLVLVDCLNEVSSARRGFVQLNELLELWVGLPTDDSREGVLVAVRRVAAEQAP